MKSSKILSSLPGIVVLVALVVLGLIYMPASASGSTTPYPYPMPTQTPTGSVSGNVTLPNSYPAPINTSVRLYASDGKTVQGETATKSDGSYQLKPVEKGMYLIKAIAPETSRYLDSLPKSVSVLNNDLTGINLKLAIAQVKGIVFSPDGVTPAPARILVYRSSGGVYKTLQTETGYFKLGGLEPGLYYFEAFPTADAPLWKSNKGSLSIFNTEYTQEIKLTLTQAQVWGRVVTSQDEGVPNATVTIANRQGLNRRDTTSPSGYFAIGGLPASGVYALAAIPPIPTPAGMQPSDVITITLPGANNPYSLTLAIPKKIVQGVVKTHTDLPVSDAKISARRVGADGAEFGLTNANGEYQMNLGPGLWAMTVQPAVDTANWIYEAQPQLVTFLFNNQDETRTQNFKVLAADATISGSVFLPDGLTAPTFTVTVGLHNDEGVGRIIKIAPGTGSFSTPIPSGSYKVDVFIHNPHYIAPKLEPITIPANGDYANLNVTLLSRDSVIEGTISANGTPVAGIPVIAWRPNTPGSMKTFSGSDGKYLFILNAGDWHIQPAPLKDQPYIYTGSGADLTLAVSQHVSGIDFNLQAADAVIQGVIVDSQNLPIAENGWAKARLPGEEHSWLGSPIVNGEFKISIPAGAAGSVYKVSANMPSASQYVSSAEYDVTVMVGQTTLVTITLGQKNAVINGYLYDPRSNQAVTGVEGKVSAWNGDDWATAPIDPATSIFNLDVFPGLWRLNYNLDPQAEYVKLVEARNIPVENGQTVSIRLPVTRKDASISGFVYGPDGAPLSEATVWVKGTGPVVENIWLQTKTDDQGAYTLPLPYGAYRLSGAYSNPDWIAPKDIDVVLTSGQHMTGKDLRFSTPSLTISGSLTVNGAAMNGEVYVWAWSDNGGFVHNTFPVSLVGSTATGTYQLNVSSATTWHIGAAYKEQNAYWNGKADVVVAETSLNRDITLAGPQDLPAPIVVTFDANQDQVITLADGTYISIPAGAMPTSGMVTLHIVPIATLPQQKHASVVRYGYAFLATDENGQPIEQHFNQEVAISFTYAKNDLAGKHIGENGIKPAYFSTTTNRWTFPESYVIDTNLQRVTMQIDHFTEFALTGIAQFPVFIPFMGR